MTDAQPAQLDMAALKDMIDFKKLGETTGIPGMELMEAGKSFEYQLDYLQRLFDAIFEMQSEFYMRWFCANGEKPGKYRAIYSKHFPKGREYYQKRIAEANKNMEAMQAKLMASAGKMIQAAQAPPVSSSTVPLAVQIKEASG